MKNLLLNRRSPIILTLVIAMAFLAACGGSEKESVKVSEKPGIIMITVGTLRADHLGVYGYERDTSPNIDAFAAEAARFEWAFSQAPNTAPAQASLHTGRYPSSHGLMEDTSRLPDEATTLAEALSAEGYVTAAFVDGGYLSEGLGFGQGFDLFDSSAGGGLTAILPKASSWLQEHADESFFLFLHTYDLHTPYDPPAEFRQSFLDGLEEVTSDFEPTAERMEALRQAAEAGSPEPLSVAEVEYAKALYDAEIRHADERIGAFLRQLEELGLDERVVIVLTADHGEAFQEHGSVLHDRLNSSVTRVPLLLRLPAGEQAGVVSKVVEAIDLMPTLLDLAGAATPDGIDGNSLMPLVDGQASPPYVAFSESTFHGGQIALAQGGYHLIAGRDGTAVEFYNLHQDGAETQNLVASESDRVETLSRRLEAWQETLASGALGADESQSEMDEATLEQLRSLGYIQ